MPNFTITPKAHRFMKMMVMTDGGPDAGFRLAVTPGDCSGLSAEIAVLAEPLAGDAVVTRDGLKLFLPVESRVLLRGRHHRLRGIADHHASGVPRRQGAGWLQLEMT